MSKRKHLMDIRLFIRIWFKYCMNLNRIIQIVQNLFHVDTCFSNPWFLIKIHETNKVFKPIQFFFMMKTKKHNYKLADTHLSTDYCYSWSITEWKLKIPSAEMKMLVSNLNKMSFLSCQTCVSNTNIRPK